MAQRIVRTVAALATAALLALPTAAVGDTDHGSAGTDPHTSHDAGHGAATTADPHANHDMESNAPDPHAGHDAPPGSASDQSQHDTSTPAPTGSGGHDDHGTTAPESGGHDDHGTTAPESGSHDDHGEGEGDGHEQLPDTVSPEVRNLVLSGFAGVNAAVILGAFLVRRTGSNPDPRKNRTGKATR